MLKKATGLDADGNVQEMWYVGDLHISEIDPEDSHKVTTEDTDGETDEQDFVGGRPDDR